MTLVRRENSKFWYVQFQMSGKTVIRSTRTTDKRIASQVADKIRAEAHAEQMLGRKEPITLATAIQRFIDTKVGTPNYKNLISRQRTILTILDGSVLLTKISSATLEEFRRKRVEQGCGPQIIKHGMNLLAGAIRLARKDGYTCPAIEVPTIKITNKMVRYLTIEEEKRLLRELDPKRQANGLPKNDLYARKRIRWMQDNLDLVTMLIDTGARYSEIANIAWKQIDLPNLAIRLWRSKVQNESVIFMTDRVAAILQRRQKLAQGEFVFSNKAGKARGYSPIAIIKAIKRAGLEDCTIHTLRHTHATRLVQNGCDFSWNEDPV